MERVSSSTSIQIAQNVLYSNKKKNVYQYMKMDFKSRVETTRSRHLP